MGSEMSRPTLSEYLRMAILVMMLPAVFWIWEVRPIGPCR